MNIPEENNKLIKDIVVLELEMFKAVNSSVCSPCQEHLNTFKTMRRMHHSVMPTSVLTSYLKDLETAKKAGRNLMTEKYARMENRIKPLKESRHIDDIVEIEWNWMIELMDRFPKTFQGTGEMFKVYAQCELETLSDTTLKLLYEFVRKASLEKCNLVEERYNNLFQGFGYKSLADREFCESEKDEIPSGKRASSIS